MCQKDSDMDGKTNGEELGDPNCVWKQGDTFKFVSAKFRLNDRIIFLIASAIIDKLTRLGGGVAATLKRFLSLHKKDCHFNVL